MPLYEFRCSSCDRVFELLLSLDSPTERDCPGCGGKAVRIISRTAALVKNSTSGVYGHKFGNCDRSNPCCGREEPCDHKPCEDR